MAQKINRSAIYQILDKYKEYSWEGLQDHKTGRSETILNPKIADEIIEIREKEQIISSPAPAEGHGNGNKKHDAPVANGNGGKP